MAATLLASLVLGGGPARAENSSVETRRLDPLVEQLLLSTPSASPSRAAVTIGRAQDIVGTPVDFTRVPKSTAVTGGASAGKGLAGLPTHVSLPNVLPISGLLTSRFGVRWHPIRGGYRSHSGIDLAAPTGAPVYAPVAGIVQSAGWDGGYGLAVLISHGGGLTTRYGHLSRQAVTPGQKVSAGALIGYVGSTGLSSGPHLHYEIRRDGVAIDPLSGRSR